MKNCFLPADILMPKNCSIEDWSVIACDQYTSEPEYWDQIRQRVADVPSTLHMILPEAELGIDNTSKIDNINRYMEKCLADDVFTTYSNSFVYVERTLCSGAIRQGVVGMVDLEYYGNPDGPMAGILATEQTVPERIPPRVKIRENAALEFTHTVIFCDDPLESLIGSLAAQKDQLTKLYDFDLMTNGGHISGWLVDGDHARLFKSAIDLYEEENVYLVGDGNHSLLTAKRCYEQQRKNVPEEQWAALPSRYALIELENIHSPAMVFEPIYRVITHTDPQKLLDDLSEIRGENGIPVEIVTETSSLMVQIQVPQGKLITEVLQNFLDKWLEVHPGSIDYIHGEQVVRDLVCVPDAIGFILPQIDKGMLFPYVRSGKITPRKTFSIGHSSEKRYYLEGRKIV